MRPNDAAWRDAGQPVGLTILGGEQVSIGAGRAAGDAPLMMTAGEPGRGMPWPIVSHWTFDSEHPAVEIGDDDGVSVRAIATLAREEKAITSLARRSVSIKRS